MCTGSSRPDQSGDQRALCPEQCGETDSRSPASYILYAPDLAEKSPVLHHGSCHRPISGTTGARIEGTYGASRIVPIENDLRLCCSFQIEKRGERASFDQKRIPHLLTR